MGRNARRRAEKKETEHVHGVDPDPSEASSERRCPRCGSTNVFVGRTHAFQRGYLDIICGNCNWQGELPIQGW